MSFFRRDFLKWMTHSVAATAGTSILGPGAHAQPVPPPDPNAGNIFDVKGYGATGDGKTVDTPAINRVEGVVTDVGYLGGFTTYKVKLDSGAVVRSSMANTARLDLDAYSTGQRVVAWFIPDDCVVLEQ